MSEMTADWNELMIPQRIMRPSIAALAKNNWTSGAAIRHIIIPISDIKLSLSSP